MPRRGRQARQGARCFREGGPLGAVVRSTPQREQGGGRTSLPGRRAAARARATMGHRHHVHALRAADRQPRSPRA
eukprot:851630-Pleurochrysis_carterae.AAC.1